ncbi:glycoside hydrolase family 9 protein [uncultured Ruminococcus sp.]|uniref:glycoside hydrolase family 9 protein n=1 Tax=uncultured Ruminococcus sp. TaxID=165186 RepID=UPI0026238E14|nr:glycoside hydrolase family 9 protein [uncultured Ruminococcus sp.]
MHLSKRIISAMTCGAALSSLLTGSLGTAVAAGETAAEVSTSAVTATAPKNFDYAKALQYSIYFYDANMCGTEVGEHTRFSWRDDCHTYDAHVPMVPWDGNTEEGGGTNLSQAFMDKYKDVLDPDGDGTIDVSGGMHDAGDHVEFGMPENYAAATLGWGYYEFRDSYKKLGQDDHIETVLRHFNDYLMKCTFRDKDGTVIAHCYQVGEGHIDHRVWEAPEVDTMVRPAYFLTAEKPQTDYVVSACASLAINYLNFKDTDPDYAEKSLDYALALWKFANDNPKELSDNGDGPSEFYSSGKWEDDYCWAAAWLYLCTGDASVFDEAYKIFDYYAASGWVYCWNDVWSGASILWAVINEQHPELDMVNKIRKAQGKNEYVFKDFWDDDCIGKCLTTYKKKVTAQGMVFIDVWGSCRYASAFALICLVYDKYHNDGKPSEWSEFAKKQIDYILGDNDITYKENEKQTVLAGRNGTHGPRCFLCGYDETYSVMNPHHRAASGLTMAEDPRQQKHILWGALAGGPDAKDAHSDSTNDWRENEVTIDYNAAFVGACAGMYEVYGTDDMKVTENFPPEDSNGGDETEGSGYWVEALGLDNRNDDNTGAIEVTLKVYSGFAKPSKDITVRYYIDASEVKDPSIIETKMLYDQASVEIKGASSEISELKKWDKMDNVYYVEMKWNDCSFANSGKKYQFSVGFYGKGYTENNKYYVYEWDPTNDWSYQTLKLGVKEDFFAVEDPPEQRCDNICVYDNGVLVGGIEPDGTKPEEPTKEDSSSTTTTTTTTTTITTSPTSANVTLYGDANCDKTVNIADAVLVMQVSTNPDKYAQGKSKLSITATGEANADVDGKKGLSNADALLIQQHKLGLIKKFPVEE